MITNEEFMADLERDYPNEDWDNLPDPETFPDVYTVHGKQWEQTMPFKDKQLPPRQVEFEVGVEYATIEEAQAQVEKCKAWGTTYYHRSTFTVIPESLEIRAVKPREAVDKWLMKEFRADILAGKKVFPMYLP